MLEKYDILQRLEDFAVKVGPVIIIGSFMAFTFSMHVFLRLFNAESWPAAAVLAILVMLLIRQWSVYDVQRRLDAEAEDDLD